MDLNKLENDVLQMFLKGDDPMLSTLRRQLAVASVKERDYTASGFFTMLEIPLDAPRLEHSTSHALTDVLAEHPGLEYGAGFVLFIEGGVLNCLEAFTYGEDWPGADDDFVLRYWSSGDERDMERVHAKLRPAE